MTVTCNPYAIAKALLDRLVLELAETRAGVPARASVVPSPQAAVIEQCSSAWVAVGGIAAAEARATGWRGDPIPEPSHRMTLTMGVYRCYPVDPKLAAPPAPAVDSAARDVLDDFEAMRRAALRAWWDAAEDEWDLEPVLGLWRPVAPSGGRHGSTMEVSVTADLSMMSDEAAPPDADPTPEP